MPASRRRLSALYFSLAAAQALAALIWLVRIPADPKNAVLFGLSAERWALLAGPVIVLGFSVAVLVGFRRDIARATRLEGDFAGRLMRSRLWGWVLIASTLAGMFSALLILITLRETPFVLAPRGALPDLEIDAYFVDLSYFEIELYLPRLLPLLVLLAGLCLQTIILLPLFLYDRKTVAGKLKTSAALVTLAVFGLSLLLLYGTVSALRAHGGDAIGWNTIGGPILDTQAAAAFGLAFILLAAGTWIVKRVPGAGGVTAFASRHADKAVFILIWTAAAVHWTAIPLEPSWYLAAPRTPHGDFVANSDALIYDLTAQNMLAGERLESRAFDDVIVRRPLYTFLVGVFRTINGPGYLGVSALQSILLALFPAVVFLVGRDMHSRLAGLAAAVLIVWREGNTIALSDQITVAHSRLLMSDLPTALGVALFIWLAARWMRDPGRSGGALLAAGGVLGGLVLVRPETALIFPVAVFFAWLAVRGRVRPVLPGAAWMAIGVALMLTPWLFRNYAGTGRWFIEVPGNRLDFLINRFRTQTEVPSFKPAARADLQEGEQTGSRGIDLVGAHFLHSNLQAILIFPTSVRVVDAAFGYTQHEVGDHFLESCCYRTNYVRRLPFWNWLKWDLDLPVETRIPIAANLLILAVGLVHAYRKRGPVGLMPLAVGQVHFAINGLARTSGGRYILPVDWIWIVYYAFGFVQIAAWTLRLLTRAPFPAWLTALPPAMKPRPAAGRHTMVAPAAAVLLIGSLLPLGEAAYPKIYPLETPAEWLQEAAGLSGNPTGLESFLAAPRTVVLHGRALYPRYYDPGTGEAGTTFPNLYPEESARITLFVAGPTSSGVRLVVAGLPGFAVPHGADVLVIGCRVNSDKEPYVEAAGVYFPGSGMALERAGGLGEIGCPLR